MPKVAVIQLSMRENSDYNIENAVAFVREAAQNGAQIILLPELFESLYFCKDIDKKYFSLAKERQNNPLIERFSNLAKELEVVLPISYFEKDGSRYFNSLVVIDADGRVFDYYRKTHIPDGPGYEEKFYFTPGDTGFKVWDTRYAKIGVGICWDQWFCESARVMALMGAQLIMYPTAIGSEPEIDIDSASHWQRVQQGHAATNLVPVMAANRVGIEQGESCTLNFYGSSFITDISGAIVGELERTKEGIIYADIDLESDKKLRDYWAIFKDRRPQTYLQIVKT